MLMRGTIYTVLLTLAIAGPVVIPITLHMLSGAGLQPPSAATAPRVAAMGEASDSESPGHTVASRLDAFGAAARARLRPAFRHAGVAYPPARLRLVAFKAEDRLALYAAGADDEELAHVRSYDMAAGPAPVTAAAAGPKLRAGDRRVPEGLYRLEALNPNSVAHVSVAIGYPNRYDRARAEEAGRGDLGGEIVIHGGGGPGTEGCLALADRDVEEVFTLIADARGQADRRTDAPRGGDGGASGGAEKAGRVADILIAPRDFRRDGPDTAALMAAAEAGRLPDWTPELYREIARSLARLPTGDDGRRLRTLLASD